MQVTDEMARAAWDRWLELEAEGGLDRDTVMRHAVQAALDAMPKATGGYVDGDSIRVRLSDASCTYTLPSEMTRGELPPNATVSINLDAADDKTIIETLSRVLGSLEQRMTDSPLAALGGHSLADAQRLEGLPGRLDLRAAGGPLIASAASGRSAIVPEPEPMPVTEPRPLARQSELHLHLGIGEVAMARMIRFRDDYRPPTPLPIHEATADSEALYDPEEVRAWYDALPKASDG